MGQRIEYIDIAKGFGIFCIVVGHGSNPWWMNYWLYSFHVPLFFIISGFFYRQRSLSETLSKCWRQLLIPMFITLSIAHLTLSLLFLRHGIWEGPPVKEWIVDILLMRYTGNVFGQWFLMALVWGKIFMCLCHKLGDKGLLIGIFLLMMICLIFRDEAVNTPWYLIQGLIVPLYLYVGMILKKYSILDKLSSPVATFISILILSIAWRCPVYFFAMQLPYGFLSIVTTILLSIAVLLVIKKASELSEIPKRLFIFAGQNTLLILCVHSLIHCLQVDKIIRQALQTVCIEYYPLMLVLIAFAECGVLVCIVYHINKLSFVSRLFHAK